MGAVGRDAQLLGDLARRQPVTQVQVEDAGVAGAEGGGRGPRRTSASSARAAASPASSPWSVRRSTISVVSSSPRGTDRRSRSRRLSARLRPDAQHPATERLGLLEPGEPRPGGQEGVLGDLGRHLPVADDAVGDVEHPGSTSGRTARRRPARRPPGADGTPARRRRLVPSGPSTLLTAGAGLPYIFRGDVRPPREAVVLGWHLGLKDTVPSALGGSSVAAGPPGRHPRGNAPPTRSGTRHRAVSGGRPAGQDGHITDPLRGGDMSPPPPVVV